MAKNAKVKIEVEGEKKYKEAIAEINRESATLGAQMKKLAAEYEGNEKSLDALQKKQTLQERMLDEQNAKVEETKRQLQSWRDALERIRQEQGATSDEYKEAQKKVQVYEKALADAETQQIKLGRAVDDTTKEIAEQGNESQESGKKMGNLGDQVSEIAGKLGIQIPDGAKKALSGIKGMSIESAAALTGISVAVAAVIEAIKKLNELTLESAKNADDLLTKSQTTGVSTTMLQQIQYAAPYIDVSVETITGALTKITKTAQQNQEDFRALGVSITDTSGHLRDSTDILYATLEALSYVENGTERDALAMQLLGKSAQELNPLINNLDAAQRLYNEAVEEGFVLSEEQLERLQAVDDAHEKYTQTIQRNKDLIALQWSPTTKQAYEMLTKLMDKAGKTLIDSKLVENFGALVNSTMGLLEAGANLFDIMPSWINPLELLSESFRGLAIVMATVADAANVIAGLMPWNWGSGMATTALGWNIGKGQMSNLQQLKYGDSGWTYNEEIGAWNATGNDNWRGGLTWVGESGAEVVALPQGSRIFNAQESRELGGVTNWNVTVQNIDQLSQLWDWFESRQIRGRMA